MESVIRGLFAFIILHALCACQVPTEPTEYSLPTPDVEWSDTEVQQSTNDDNDTEHDPVVIRLTDSVAPEAVNIARLYLNGLAGGQLIKIEKETIDDFDFGETEIPYGEIWITYRPALDETATAGSSSFSEQFTGKIGLRGDVTADPYIIAHELIHILLNRGNDWHDAGGLFWSYVKRVWEVSGSTEKAMEAALVKWETGNIGNSCH